MASNPPSIGTLTVGPGGVLTLNAVIPALTNTHLTNQGQILTQNPAILNQFASITQQGAGNIQGPADYPGTLIADLNAGDSLAIAAAKPTA